MWGVPGRDDMLMGFTAIQVSDGSIEPEIVVHRLHADQPIKCVAAARQLARAIMAAANEIDGLT
jgi:hypothetical protein